MLDSLFISLIIISYLLGSISSAIILSKIMGFPDPRSEGSLNPGATNVMRIAGKKAAAITLVGDMLKGFAPTIIAFIYLDNLAQVALIGFSAFIGHCFPIFYRFNGGKGVATAIGSTLAINWVFGLFTISIWLIVAKGFKLSSLAALIAFTLLPFFTFWYLENLDISLIFALISIILISRHKENIKRLIKGTEN